MNIFVLAEDPLEAAAYHCDKHVLKMIIEYAQLLSTAHRVLDGEPKYIDGKKYLALPGETPEKPLCYKSTHVNHPCAIWARTNDLNYAWLRVLFGGVLQEYTARYGRVHRTSQYLPFLRNAPKNIRTGWETPFPLAMPDQYKVKDDAVASYRNYYIYEKARFARWTNTPVPAWFTASFEGPDAESYFTRTR